MPKTKKIETTEIVPVKKVPAKRRSKQVAKTEIASPEILIMQAMKQGASLETIERLLDLKDRVQKQEAEKAYHQAMSKFQAECPEIPKTKKVMNKDGKTVRYKYAPIEVITKIVSPYLGNNGLYFTFKTKVEFQDKSPGITATCFVRHILGHSEENSFWSPLDESQYMTEQQRWGSTRTFAARYAISDGLGIVTIDMDNDANNPPGDDKQKQEADQKAKEALAKLHNFLDSNEYIKKAFEILDYTERAQWSFCEGNKWNAEIIKKHLNMLVDKQNAK